MAAAKIQLPKIRRARSQDATRLSVIAEATFRDAFGALNTPADMDLHCQNSYSETIQADEIADPSMLTLLCEDGEKLCGFAQLRWGEGPSCLTAAAPGEIQRLYIVREFHGKGAAHELMRTCLAAMKSHQSDVVWLGVWERNPRAIAFYEKFGFNEMGEHVFPVGRDRQRDIVMARPVID